MGRKKTKKGGKSLGIAISDPILERKEEADEIDSVDGTPRVTKSETDFDQQSPPAMVETTGSTPETKKEEEVPRSASIRYESTYPDRNEFDIDTDCLVPNKSPLRKDDSETVLTFGEIYKDNLSPKIHPRDERATSDSTITEVDKADRSFTIPSGEIEDLDHSATWRDVDEDKEEEDISVLTENILTPERVPENKERPFTASFVKEQKEQAVYNEAATSSYRDIVEDYLETISDGLIRIMAFLKPNKKHQHYEDYLKAKVNYILWPLTFVLPTIVVEVIRFLIVSYLLLLGTFFLAWWYSVKYTVWIAFAPWRFFQRAMGWLFQIFVYLSVGFVNNARGGNKISSALNGHVMKH